MLDEQAKDFEKGQNHKNVYQRICVHLRLSAANPNFKTLSQGKHHRHSIRLKGFDYSRAGAYFVTIVAFRRECLFGEIADGNMRLNEAGRIVQWEWLNLSQRFDYVELGTFVIMPNHFHGLVTYHETVGATRQGKTNASSNKTPSYNMAFESIAGPPLPRGPKPTSLGAIIAQFKSRPTKRLWKIPSLTRSLSESSDW